MLTGTVEASLYLTRVNKAKCESHWAPQNILRLLEHRSTSRSQQCSDFFLLERSKSLLWVLGLKSWAEQLWEAGSSDLREQDGGECCSECIAQWVPTGDWLKSRSFVVSERRSGLSPVKHAWGRPIIMTTHSTAYSQLTPRLQDEMFPVSDFDHLPSLSFPLPFQATTASTVRSPSALVTLVLEPPTTMWAGTSVESPSQESGNHRISSLQVHPPGLLD